MRWKTNFYFWRDSIYEFYSWKEHFFVCLISSRPVVRISLESCLCKLSNATFQTKIVAPQQKLWHITSPPPLVQIKQSRLSLGRSNSTRKSGNDLNCFVLVIICSPLILKNLIDKLFSVVGFWFKGLVDWKVSHCIK